MAMPTARELLEQTDALMRRNRALEQDLDIPELTDAVIVASPALPVRDPPKAPAAMSQRRQRRSDNVSEPSDAIEEVSIQPLPDEAENSRWLDVDMGEASITGEVPDTLAVVPPATLHSPPPASAAEASSGVSLELPPDVALERPPSDGTLETPSPDVALEPPSPDVAVEPLFRYVAAEAQDMQASVPMTATALLATHVAGTFSDRPAAAKPASDPGFDAMLGITPTETVPAPDAPGFPADDRLQGLAEEIRMQVLQRIDIFTDTGLQGELAARLQPIVDRASADLMTTINREVGQILRAYVAEAIEREIEKWRKENP